MKMYYLLLFILLLANCKSDENNLREKELALKEKELELKERELDLKEKNKQAQPTKEEGSKAKVEAISKNISLSEFLSSLDPFTTEYLLIYENRNRKKPILEFNMDSKKGKLFVNGEHYSLQEYRGQDNSFQLLGSKVEIMVTNEQDDQVGDCIYSIADANIKIPRFATKELKGIYIQRCSPLNFQ